MEEIPLGLEEEESSESLESSLQIVEISLPTYSSSIEIANICNGDCDMSMENLAVAECVLRIIQNGIQKIQIASLIPVFLNDAELLLQCMGRSRLARCVQYHWDYINNLRLMETNRERCEIPLIELIDLFCENENIQDILPEYVPKNPKQFQGLLDALRQLKIIAGVRLKTSAFAEMHKEKAIHRIYNDNVKAIAKVARLKKQLKRQEHALRWKLFMKRRLIQKYEEVLAVKKSDNNLKIKREILRSAHKIKEFHANSIIKQDLLTESVEKAKASYEKFLKSNLRSEKDIRDEKNKLVLQLQGLLRKFDQNIFEKIRENEEIQVTYDEQRQKMEEFMVEFKRQEAEYTELANFKLEEETAEFEQKLLLFITNRAAKVIQRHWRKYLKVWKGWKGGHAPGGKRGKGRKGAKGHKGAPKDKKKK